MMRCLALVALWTFAGQALAQTTQPAATQPTEAARKKAAAILKSVDEVTFEFRYVGVSDKPFYRVTLSVPDFMLDEPKTFDLIERITPDQGRKIVGLLLADGWFNKALDRDMRAKDKLPAWSGYVLRIRGYAVDREVAGEFGWDLPMIRRLDAIDNLLDGDAKKAMDTLIARLAGIRRHWQELQPATTQP